LRIAAMTNRYVRFLSRRQFGAGAALAAVETIASPAAADLPTVSQTAIDAKYANVIRKFGDRLTEEQRKRVRDIIANHERMLARIRAVPLENADAPATGFRL
jgi:hypothetical protein